MAATETLQAEYGDRIQLVIIYTLEAHPVGSPSPYSGEEWTTPASTDEEDCPLAQPETYDQRVAQATQMTEELGITVPVLIDEMDNPAWCTYGPAPNIAYLIGRDGVVIEKQGWYQPRTMETAMVDYLAGDGN